MRVAAVSISYNESIRLNQWIELYSGYKDNLAYHIIVDNNSNQNNYDAMEKLFPNSTIIKLDKNYGFNKAHNVGIKYALEHTDADAILYIGTDFMLSDQCIPVLYNYLKSNSKLAIVFPVEIDQKSLRIINFGHKIRGTSIHNYLEGQPYEAVRNAEQYTDMIEGGCHMISREYASMAGFYDEKLFMYADEIETSYRAKRNGVYLGVTGKVFCQHRHIDSVSGKNKRNPFSMYLIARNGVFLAKKYKGNVYGFFWFLRYSIKKTLLHFGKGVLFFNSYYITCALYALLGGINGLKGNLEENKYSHP